MSHRRCQGEVAERVIRGIVVTKCRVNAVTGDEVRNLLEIALALGVSW